MRFSYLDSSDLTDTGKHRTNNEDALLRLPGSGVFCVADGMGGASGGEIASRALTDALAEAFSGRHSAADPDFGRAKELVKEAALNANEWIREYAVNHDATGMGSTLVVLAFDPDSPARGVVLHAGDSRAYRMRGDALVRLTRDHSLVSEAGLDDGANLGPMFRAMVTRAVGIRVNVELDETPVDVMENDLFLLCSDGLTTMLRDDELARILRENKGLGTDALCQLLVDEANRRGGEDNITVVLTRVGKFPEAAGPAAVETATLEPVEPAVPAGVETPDTGEEMEANAMEERGEPVERDTTPPSDNGDGLAAAMENRLTPTSDLECVTPAAEDEEQTTERDAVPPSTPARPQALAPMPVPEVPPQKPAPAPASTPAPGPSAPARLDPPHARPAQRLRPAPMPAPDTPNKIWIAAAVIGLGAIVAIALFVIQPSHAPRKEAVSHPAGVRQVKTVPAVTAVTTVAPPLPEVPSLSDHDIRNLRATLPTRLDATLQTGGWGSMSVYAGKWSQAVPNLLEKSGKSLVYASWVALWTKMRDGGTDASLMHRQYREEISTLCRKAGFVPPPEESESVPATPPELRADTACRLIYKLQKHLGDNIRDLVRKCRTETETMGRTPAQPLSDLWAFTWDSDERTLAACVARAGGIAKDMAQLDKWLAAWGDSQIPTASIRNAPGTIIPRLQQAMREQRETIARQVEKIPLSIRTRRQGTPASLTSTLDRIDAFFEKALKGQHASDPAVWQGTGSSSALRAMFDEIRNVMRTAGDARRT